MTADSFTSERRQEVLDLSLSILSPQKRTKRGICLVGPVGRGKTLMATLLARRFVRKGYDEQWLAMCRVPCLISRARDQYSLGFSERETVEDMLEVYTEKCFLVIDDLGVRRGEATPFEQGLLYRLIDERYLTRERTFTVITTNRTLADIDRDIDERVRSRIMGMCHVIHLDGPDWRTEN
ncbi:ATP-binding protein [Nitrospinae bacterium AH-259-F20]|nr:ATP-binding protein [Nitrospinae bacterium AH-259-F20]